MSTVLLCTFMIPSSLLHCIQVVVFVGSISHQVITILILQHLLNYMYMPFCYRYHYQFNTILPKSLPYFCSTALFCWSQHVSFSSQTSFPHLLRRNHISWEALVSSSSPTHQLCEAFSQLQVLLTFEPVCD